MTTEFAKMVYLFAEISEIAQANGVTVTSFFWSAGTAPLIGVRNVIEADRLRAAMPGETGTVLHTADGTAPHEIEVQP